MNNPTFPRAVIFDWDNTLVDSYTAIAGAINFTRNHFGHPVWTMAEVKMNCRRSARDSFPEWFGDRWQEAIDIYYQHFAKIHIQNLSPTAGSETLLRWLQAQGVPSFIVSNKNGDYLRREVEALQWNGFFISVAGAKDAARDKPAREPVDYVLERGSLKAEASIWFVGDTEIDMQCARNAGCTPVFIGEEKEAERLAVELAFSDCHALQRLLYNRTTK